MLSAMSRAARAGLLGRGSGCEPSDFRFDGPRRPAAAAAAAEEEEEEEEEDAADAIAESGGGVRGVRNLGQIWRAPAEISVRSSSIRLGQGLSWLPHETCVRRRQDTLPPAPLARIASPRMPVPLWVAVLRCRHSLPSARPARHAASTLACLPAAPCFALWEQSRTRLLPLVSNPSRSMLEEPRYRNPSQPAIVVARSDRKGGRIRSRMRMGPRTVILSQ